MALQKEISKFGITVNNAYHVINHVYYDKGLNSPTALAEPTNATAVVFIYSDVDAKTNNAEPMERITHNFNLDTSSDSEDALTQAYTYLKTLDEYSDATDV